jgi:hypothetical protein
MIAAFIILDGLVMYWMNRDAAASIAITGQVDWQMFMNAPTLIVLGILVFVQLIAMLYVNSFFMSGFAGMCKNYVKDGSTKFAEFMPSVKRYWHGMFWLLFIRYVLLIVIVTPFLLALMSYLGTTPELVTTAQWAALLVTMVVMLVLGTFIYLAFFYGEAAVVFEEMTARQAIKRSWQLTKENFGKTFLAVLSVLLIVIAASLIVTLLLLPFDIIVSNTLGDSTWILVRDVADWTFKGVFTSIATIVAVIFALLTYNEIVGGKQGKAPVKKVEEKAPEKKAVPAKQAAVAKKKKA